MPSCRTKTYSERTKLCPLCRHTTSGCASPHSHRHIPFPSPQNPFWLMFVQGSQRASPGVDLQRIFNPTYRKLSTQLYRKSISAMFGARNSRSLCGTDKVRHIKAVIIFDGMFGIIIIGIQSKPRYCERLLRGKMPPTLVRAAEVFASARCVHAA